MEGHGGWQRTLRPETPRAPSPRKKGPQCGHSPTSQELSNNKLGTAPFLKREVLFGQVVSAPPDPVFLTEGPKCVGASQVGTAVATTALRYPGGPSAPLDRAGDRADVLLSVRHGATPLRPASPNFFTPASVRAATRRFLPRALYLPLRALRSLPTQARIARALWGYSPAGWRSSAGRRGLPRRDQGLWQRRRLGFVACWTAAC